MAKINISVDDDTLLRADDFAKKNGVSRSALIAIALNDYIYAKEKEPEVTRALKRLTEAYTELARSVEQK